MSFIPPRIPEAPEPPPTPPTLGDVALEILEDARAARRAWRHFWRMTRARSLRKRWGTATAWVWPREKHADFNPATRRCYRCGLDQVICTTPPGAPCIARHYHDDLGRPIDDPQMQALLREEWRRQGIITGVTGYTGLANAAAHQGDANALANAYPSTRADKKEK